MKLVIVPPGLTKLNLILQSLLCFNDPESHPFISDKEKKFLEEAIGSYHSSQPNAIPWKAILMSVPLWALVFAQVTYDKSHENLVTLAFENNRFVYGTISYMFGNDFTALTVLCH